MQINILNVDRHYIDLSLSEGVRRFLPKENAPFGQWRECYGVNTEIWLNKFKTCGMLWYN